MKFVNTLFIGATALCLTACGDHSKNNNTTNAGSGAVTATASAPATQNATPVTAKPVYKKPTPAESKFNDMRVTAFTVTPTELKITVPTNKDVVYGVIFDQEADRVITTVAAYQNGDMALYINNGATKKLKGTEAAKFTALAQTYLDKTTKAHDTSVPAKGSVKFYLLTNKGIYVADEPVKNIADHTSAWAAMFDEGNKITVQLKKAVKKNADYVIIPAS
jgi:hypothetical protein